MTNHIHLAVQIGVCLAYHLKASILDAKSQQRNASEARAVAGWLARESGCVTITEIAGLQLKLLDTRPLSTGCVILRYQPGAADWLTRAAHCRR